MSLFHGIQYIDTLGIAHGFIDNAGSPQICSQDYLQAIAEGDVSNHLPFEKYGKCIVSNSLMDVWEQNSIYAFPVAATKLDVVSTDNVNDKAGGTGALKVKINGLDGASAEITEEVTLNGTTIVTTVASFRRINRMWVSAAGTGGAAVGTITAKITGGATIYAQISPAFTMSRQAIYSVPAGKKIYITSVTCTTGVGNTSANNKANYVTFTLRAMRDPGTLALSTLFYPIAEFGMVNNQLVRPFEIPLIIPATADIHVQVIGDINQAVTVTCALRGWIE